MTNNIRPAVVRAAARKMGRQQWRHEYSLTRFQMSEHNGYGMTAQELLEGGYTDIPEVAASLGSTNA